MITFTQSKSNWQMHQRVKSNVQNKITSRNNMAEKVSFSGENSVYLKIMVDDKSKIKDSFKLKVAQQVHDLMPDNPLKARDQINQGVGEVTSTMSTANIGVNNSVMMAIKGLIAMGMGVCGSQIKRVYRILQDNLIDPLHLARTKKLVHEGLITFPDTVLKGDVKALIEKINPSKEDKALLEKIGDFIKQLDSSLGLSPESINDNKTPEISPDLILDEKTLKRFERYAAKLQRLVAKSIQEGKEATTETGRFLQDEMYESLINDGLGFKQPVFNPWRKYPLDYSQQPFPEVKDGKRKLNKRREHQMPQSFRDAMAAQGLTNEAGLQAVWKKYNSGHAARVIEKVRELQEMSLSSIALIVEKWKSDGIPQEKIKL